MQAIPNAGGSRATCAKGGKTNSGCQRVARYKYSGGKTSVPQQLKSGKTCNQCQGRENV